MPQTPVHCPRRHRACFVEVRVVAPRVNVRQELPTFNNSQLTDIISSHDLFDEYTRRQYVAKAPDRNPFGTDETPAKFNDFDATLKVWLLLSSTSVQLLTSNIKIRVLQQLTQWVMLHPERIREKMDEQKPSDQTDWVGAPFTPDFAL